MSYSSAGCSDYYSRVLDRMVRDPNRRDRRIIDATYWILLRQLTDEGYLKYVIKDADEIFVTEIPEESIFDEDVFLDGAVTA